MRKLKYILMLTIVGVLLGVACECVDDSNVQAQTEGPKPKEVYTNSNEIDWEYTQNGFKLERLYYGYNVEYGQNSNRIDSRSFLTFFKFRKGGMEFLLIQNDYDDVQNIINITKDSLICANLAAKNKSTNGSGSSYLSDHKEWYEAN